MTSTRMQGRCMAVPNASVKTGCRGCCSKYKKMSASYGKALALEEVSLNVAAGEFVAVLGPNRVGKSTLLKCTSRMLAVTGKRQFNGGVFACLTGAPSGPTQSVNRRSKRTALMHLKSVTPALFGPQHPQPQGLLQSPCELSGFRAGAGKVICPDAAHNGAACILCHHQFLQLDLGAV